MTKSIIRVFDAAVIGGVLPLFEVEADAVCETNDELEFILYDGAGGCTTVGYRVRHRRCERRRCFIC